MMREKSRRYIQVFTITMITTVFPARAAINQNGNVSFWGAAVKQGCTAEARHQDRGDLKYTIELDECPWPEADDIRVIVSTPQHVGRISPPTSGTTVIYSGSRNPAHYSLHLPEQVLDSKEASVITFYYP